jgi:hypothetical protein
VPDALLQKPDGAGEELVEIAVQQRFVDERLGGVGHCGLQTLAEFAP